MSYGWSSDLRVNPKAIGNQGVPADLLGLTADR
jgi:hypothetical protein